MGRFLRTVLMSMLTSSVGFAAIAFRPNEPLKRQGTHQNEAVLRRPGIRPQSPGNQDVCRPEDMLKLVLSISSIENKVANQKNEVCEMKTKMLEFENIIRRYSGELTRNDSGIYTSLTRQDAELFRLSSTLNEQRSALRELKLQYEIETAKLKEMLSVITNKQNDLEVRLAAQEALIASQNDVIASLRSKNPVVHRVCPNGYVQHGGSCYTFNTVFMTWADSLVLCKAFGAHLVILNSEAEETFLRTKLLEMSGSFQKDGFWVAASDAIVEGEWYWVETGTPVNQTWGNLNNHQNQDCASLHKNVGYQMNDMKCHESFHSICEIELTEN